MKFTTRLLASLTLVAAIGLSAAPATASHSRAQPHWTNSTVPPPQP